MRQRQVIHLYCLCWNDARMLPYFFRHYDAVVDRYFVFDNGSTDGSLSLLRNHGRVETAHFEVTGNSFVDEERRLSDIIWRRSTGQADWVLLIDIDEHVYHPDLRGYLAHRSADGVTAICGIGYDMVSDAFPIEDAPLSELVVTGVRSEGFDKLCAFNPNMLTATNFDPGRHTAEPEGTVVWPERSELLLLHYKRLGVDYPIARSAELFRGLKSGDLAEGWGTHYTWSPAKIARVWADLRASAATVPGLGTLRHVSPETFDDAAAIRRTGLFDAEWYLRTYPDIAAAETNPLTHFSAHGWREGRQPNLYFDPTWYVMAHSEAAADGTNPLLHYAHQGERGGAKPSEFFEPAWYRRRHRLAASESPLAHYLVHKASGVVSPRPDFNVKAYCRRHPEVVNDALDPFEHYLAAEAAAPANEVPGVPPVDALAAALGTDVTPVELRTALEQGGHRDLVALFLSTVPLDEEWYRAQYPDVAEAIEAGAITSARHHFVEFGYFEGRRPGPDTS